MTQADLAEFRKALSIANLLGMDVGLTKREEIRPACQKLSIDEVRELEG